MPRPRWVPNLPNNNWTPKKEGFALCYRCQATPPTQQLWLHAASPASSRRPGAEKRRIHQKRYHDRDDFQWQRLHEGNDADTATAARPIDRVFTRGRHAGNTTPSIGKTVPTGVIVVEAFAQGAPAPSSRQDAGTLARHHRHWYLDVL